MTLTLFGTGLLIYAAIHILLAPGKIMEILRVLAFVTLGFIAAQGDGAIGVVVEWTANAAIVTFNWINGLFS